MLNNFPVLHSTLTTRVAVYARESLGGPKADMRVKAPFLIETTKWPDRILFRILEDGYVVGSIALLRINGKTKVCWVWAQGSFSRLVRQFRWAA